jgi:UDP-GlcNAc:undecaprenyl-phosphate GlcNAc-1-phosphate transferase
LRSYLGLFFVAAFSTWLLTPPVMALGQRVRAYGRARDKGEFILIPRLGGIAIFLAVLASASALLVVPNSLRAIVQTDWLAAVKLLIPGSLALLIGLYDDLKGATPRQKLAVEICAGAAAWWLGFRMTAVPILGFPIHSRAVAFCLTVLWIVAVTNSLNLIDGLDGLAAGVAFLVTLTLFIVSLLQGNHLACIFTVALAGTLLGFLRFNSPPARIFLGDTGSLFLGCVLAILAMAAAGKGTTLVTLTAPYVALMLPLLDTTLSVVRRLLKGKSIFAPDCDHIHHRLVAKKQGYRPAILMLYAVAAASSLGSILILHWTGSLVLLGAFLGGLVSWLVFNQLQYEELDELAVQVSRVIRSGRRALANPMVIRRADASSQPGGTK